MGFVGALILALLAGGFLLLLVPLVALRLAVALVHGKRVGWLPCLVVVVVGAAVQGCASGCAGGADGGLVGALVGWAAWSAVTALTLDMPFGRAVVVGLVMAVLQWLLLAGLLVLLVATGAAALLGLAGLALVA